MLFNSYEFLFAFLPATLIVYYWLGFNNQYRIAVSWLVGCSLFFYAWWNPSYLGLLLASMLFNYGLGIGLAGRSRSKTLLAFGVALNLGLLGYFKYTDFLIDTLNAAAGSHFNLQHIVLPLAISFFTFQQIAFLVDAYRGETKEFNFLQYALFVTFFPQLIAGPIVHHREMLPQFARDLTREITAANVGVGLTIFFIGLFKKVHLADRIAEYATPVFGAADTGVPITLFEAWGGALSYTLQLYFDFSGYADMAIGIALLFGIRLPANFNSPYKSRNIIEFWRRWHMTLSRFLKDYLYIPLGGNRGGKVRRHINLLVTMLLGGLWHGAGWTFVIWGGLHGVYLVLNHLWRDFCQRFGFAPEGSCLGACASRLLTFVAIVAAWVFFRAETVDGALNILGGMAGANGVSLPEKYAAHGGTATAFLVDHGVVFEKTLTAGSKEAIQIGYMLAIVFLLPNTQTLMRLHRPVLGPIDSHSRLLFQFSIPWLVFAYGIAVYSVLYLDRISEFLYFQF